MIAWILSAILGVLLLFFLFLLWPAFRRHPDRDLLDGQYIAHRGLHDLAVGEGTPAPENSLTAFRAAVEAGYMIENDIHITSDGEVVVFHDDDLSRMCGVKATPESMTLAELKKLRLAGTDERIPTLRECLEVVDGRVPLLIEFKCMDGATCRRLCETAAPILDAYRGKYMVQSFYPFVLRWYRKHRKDVCRGQLAAGFYHDKFYMKLAGCLLFNVLGRPDFVSYDHTTAGHVCRRLCTLLGAHPVCWTLHSQVEADAAHRSFKTFIFEGFIPLERRKGENA